MYTAEHLELARSLETFIDREINPFVDDWEKDGIFPAKELFPKLGAAGFLGVNKPVEFGGSGLDYSYGVLMAEVLGGIHCGGVPMAIGVQTDMATPALAKHGSDELRREFLAPRSPANTSPALASPNRAPARMWPPSRPAPAPTAMTT